MRVGISKEEDKTNITLQSMKEVKTNIPNTGYNKGKKSYRGKKAKKVKKVVIVDPSLAICDAITEATKGMGLEERINYFAKRM